MLGTPAMCSSSEMFASSAFLLLLLLLPWGRAVEPAKKRRLYCFKVRKDPSTTLSHKNITMHVHNLSHGFSQSGKGGKMKEVDNVHFSNGGAAWCYACYVEEYYTVTDKLDKCRKYT